MSICVLCEKPSQAKDIAQVLGATSRQEGFIEGNGYTVTWCIGHLLRLAPPEEYCTNLQPWRMEVLPVIPSEWKLLPNPKTSKQLTVIKRLLKKTRHVIIATDADREGDVIGREVLEYCNYQDKIERLWLSALDDASIKKALSDIKPDRFSRDLYYAGLGRSRADWTVGMNLSMAATVKFSNGGGVLSVGRVQSPTLKLIVDRDFNIENFQPHNYYDLCITLSHDKKDFIAKWEVPESLADEAGRCLMINEAESVLRKVKDQSAKVIHYQSKEKKQSPPLGLSLSVLQKLCSSKFGFSAKKTLELAQSLYETHKATTYPRTDCVYLPTSQLADSKIILKLLNEKNKHYQEFIKKCDLSSQSPIWNDKKITAHHAIIPTLNNKVSFQAMSDDEKNIYDLICRYYIAQFLGDYRYQHTEVNLMIDQEKFKASTQSSTDLGWKMALAVINEKEESAEDDEFKQSIPELQTGELILCNNAVITEKQTKALSRFTEGSLITAMKNIANYLEDKTAKTILRETAGIGTEATRANIIEILIARDYIERKGKQLISTSKGRKLISVLPSQVTDPIMTAHWESQLDDIAQGKANLEDFMAAQKLQINALLQALFSQEFQSINSETLSFSCEKCQKNLVRRQGKFGYFWSCSGYPECSAKYKDIRGKPQFETNEYGCPECQTGYLQLRAAKKGKFWGCNGYPTCKTIVSDKRGKPEQWRKP